MGKKKKGFRYREEKKNNGKEDIDSRSQSRICEKEEHVRNPIKGLKN